MYMRQLRPVRHRDQCHLVEGGISMFMEKLATGYSSYFNKYHERKGVLFQNRFQAEEVIRDEHLKYLYAYIHLNPIKLIEPTWKETGIKNSRRAKDYLSHYEYSSYLDHSGTEREQGLILSRGEFPEYFDTPHAFADFVHDWLEYKDL